MRQPLSCAVALLALGSFAGCASNSSANVSSGPAIPAPASGTAWQALANGGGATYGETSADATPWITVGADGAINARIPASAQTQAAAGAVEAGNVGVLTIRRAP